MNTISNELLEAYRETNYVVVEGKPFTIKIGDFCPALKTVMTSYVCKECCFITAVNPFSLKLYEIENTKRQEQLHSELKARGFRFLNGYGEHPSGNWRKEPSLLVLGLSLSESMKLGTKYEQNAIVWSGDDCIPKLEVLLGK